MPRFGVDGCEIHYEMSGSGEPVVLVHGLGSSILDWEYQVPVFAERHAVIAVDMRGHGRSDKPPGPYSMAMFANDITRLLDHLALGPAHIVGISMGGMIAFQLAVDSPSYVRSLVIVNSGPAVVPKTFAEKFALFARGVTLRLIGLPGLAKKIAAHNFPRADQVTLRDTLAQRLGQTDPNAYRAAFKAILGWTVEDRIQTIQAPTLIVTGDNDYTPVAAKRAYAVKMRNAPRLEIIANSRHVTPVDQPEAFNRLVLDFLAEQAKKGE